MMPSHDVVFGTESDNVVAKIQIQIAVTLIARANPMVMMVLLLLMMKMRRLKIGKRIMAFDGFNLLYGRRRSFVVRRSRMMNMMMLIRDVNLGCGTDDPS